MGEAIPTILTAFALYQDPRIVEAVARLAVESPEVAAKLVRAEAAMEQCAHIFAMLAKEAPA
jgi:Flp pilus assembly protein TadD